MSKSARKKRENRERARKIAMTPVHNPFNERDDDIFAQMKIEREAKEKRLTSIPEDANHLYEQMEHWYNEQYLGGSSKTIYINNIEEEDHNRVYIQKFRCWTDGGTLDAHNYNEKIERKIQTIIDNILENLSKSELKYDYELMSFGSKGIEVKIYKETV